MPKDDKSIRLGVVTVTVNTADGLSDIQDWAPEDAAEAREYAAETAHCRDVKSVDFANHDSGEEETITNPTLVRLT